MAVGAARPGAGADQGDGAAVAAAADAGGAEVGRLHNRQHWLLTSYSVRLNRDDMGDEPVFFAAGAELDMLEAAERHGPVSLMRRDYLRELRAAGAIADPGERFDQFARQAARRARREFIAAE